VIVHGFVTAAGRLALWAESADGAAVKAPLDGRHPFAEAVAVPGDIEVHALTLPSRRGPVPSTQATQAITRRAWTVPAVVLGPGVDPELLLQELPAKAGSSVGYLADIVAFAADLLRRGRVLPGIVGTAARWRAALYGIDQVRFEELSRAMPGVVRSGAAWERNEDALLTALDAQLDALVRARLTTRLVPTPPTRPTTVHAWLDALSGPHATVDIPPPEREQLRERLDAWRASGTPGAVRTCFRLSYVEEGEEDEPAGWLLEFLLQPVADPSVLIPARHLWSDAASPVVGWLDDPQDILLGDLGRASRLYPDLEQALWARQPSQLFLDVAGAHRFLSHAPLLEEAGFGVLVPAQWQRRSELGLTFTVHTGQPSTAVLRDHTANLDAIVDYRWGLALGAEFLTEADLVELARAKLPLVRLRGRWVYLDLEQLHKGLAFLARGGSGQMTAGEALRKARLLPERDQPLPVTGVAGDGWLAELLDGRAGEGLALLDPPASLNATLRPYQRKGLSWLAFLDSVRMGALLADDMGLGKTVQLLALEAMLRERGRRPPTLIVAPLSVLGNWQREIERFTPTLRVRVHHGSERSLDSVADLVLTTYQVAVRDVELLSTAVWDRVVLDEAQHVKNSASETARALRRIPARHRVALTGTPVENRLTDLWSIMDFLNPGLLGPASIFRARYSVPIERFGDEAAAARLRRVIRPLVLRRLKTDEAVISDLPEKFERTQWCNLTVEQATLYRAVVDDLVTRLHEGRRSQRKGLVLSAMTRLKQACNHPAHLLGDGSSIPGRSGKVDRLEEILANALADGDRALVFTQFATFGRMLVPHLRRTLGVEVAFLHGGTARGARDAMVERFQRRSGPPVLLLSLKAGGTGLNLTAASHVVHLDRWWNPAAESQATDRAFRIGQDRNVQVHTFVCSGTIEERIDRMIAEKRNLAQIAVGTDEGWLSNLSTDDLIELVALAPEPLHE
jgi:hypothetical protein